MLRIGKYVVVGAVIGVAAFVVGQSLGGGIPLVAVALSLWIAYASYRLRRDKTSLS
jgi:hypothetical protein